MIAKLGTCENCYKYELIEKNSGLCITCLENKQEHTQKIETRLNKNKLLFDRHYNYKMNIQNEIKTFAEVIQVVTSNQQQDLDKDEITILLAKLKLWIHKTAVKMNIKNNDINNEVHNLIDNEEEN